LRKAQDAVAISVRIVVGQDETAIAGSQVFDGIASCAGVATHGPRAWTAGEFAISKMETGLDQSEIWLVAHLKPTASRPGFEARIADFARHGFVASCKTSWVQYGSN